MTNRSTQASWKAYVRNPQAHSVAHHAPQTKFKEEEDDFLDKLHREYGVGV